MIVARVRSLSGQTLRTFAQRFVLSGDPPAKASGPQPRLRFLCAPSLAARAFTVESAVYDEVGDRSSVRVKSLDVQDPSRFSVGDVFLASDVSAGSRDQVQEGHPLLTASGQLLHPLLPPAVSRALQPELIVATPLQPGAVAGELRVQLSRPDGAQQEVSAAVDSDGSHSGILLFRVPTASLPDGAHQLQISGEASSGPWVRSLRVTVTP